MHTSNHYLHIKLSRMKPDETDLIATALNNNSCAIYTMMSRSRLKLMPLNIATTSNNSFVLDTHEAANVKNKTGLIAATSSYSVDVDDIEQVKGYRTIHKPQTKKIQHVCPMSKALIINVKTHTYEKPFTCETCNKSFNQHGTWLCAQGCIRELNDSLVTTVVNRSA